MEKRYTIIAIMAAMVNIANAQVAAHPSCTSVYDNEGNLTGRSQYRYDALGNQIEEIDFSEDDAVGNMKRYYTYSPNGKMLSVVLQKMVNGKWTDSTRNQLSYNADGTLTGECTSMWQDGSWKAVTKTEIEYSDKQTTKRTYNLTAGEWSIFSTEVMDKAAASDLTNCTYDDKGNLTSRITYAINDNGMRENFYKEEYTYDSDGRNTTTQTFLWDDAEWLLDTTERHDYSATATCMTTLNGIEDSSSVRKVLADGNINIIAAGKTYNINGTK